MTIKKFGGMGVVCEDTLTTFRVWAPNADKFYAIGDFNEWKKDDLEMEPEENGYWSATTDKAENGNEYKYLTHNGVAVLERNDPYAFEVTNSNGNSIVRNVDFNWEGDHFELCEFNELVIHELYIGTFNRTKSERVGFRARCEKS